MCKIEWKVLDLIIKESENFECHKDVYIKVENWDTFLIAKWTFNHNESNNCKFKTTFLNESYLPKIWDNVSYYSSFFWYEIWYYSWEDYNHICPRSPYFDYTEFHNKCNLNWKIQEVHREYKKWNSMDVHLKIKTEELIYNVKTYEWFYYWYWEGYLWWVEYFSPKSLKWWWVSFFKPWMDFKYIIDEDTWEILREWNDKEIDNCNVWEQKLSDFKFEWWLSNIEVIDLNMKKFREYKGIEEPETTWKEKYEENNFVFWFNYNNFSGWLMTSFFMLILFFVALIKNKYSKQKSIFA